MAELTRGQKAARTRQRNKAAAAEAAEDETKVSAKGVSTGFLSGFFSTIHDDFEGLLPNLQSAVYSVKDDDSGTTVQATWDGSQWRVEFI